MYSSGREAKDPREGGRENGPRLAAAGLEQPRAKRSQCQPKGLGG